MHFFQELILLHGVMIQFRVRLGEMSSWSDYDYGEMHLDTTAVLSLKVMREILAN